MSLKNRYLLLEKYLTKQFFASHGPVEIGIEITNRCTLKCIMCSRQIMKRPLGDISWELFTKIVDQTCSTAEIYLLYGLGEPLLHSQLPNMIDYCHQKGVPVAISTNATKLEREKTEMLINHPPDHFLLALDAYTNKTYQKIRKGGNFYQIRNNIKHYLKRLNQVKPPTFSYLLFVKQEINQKEIKSFINYWQKNNAPAIHIKPITEKINLKRKAIPPKRCLSPWRSLNVTWQGEVYPCCLDTNCSFHLGNLNKMSLAKIWNGQPWLKLRRSFKNGKLSPLCRSCSIRQPSLVSTLFISLLPEITIKKVFPRLDRLQQKISFLPFWR